MAGVAEVADNRWVEVAVRIYEVEEEGVETRGMSEVVTCVAEVGANTEIVVGEGVEAKGAGRSRVKMDEGAIPTIIKTSAIVGAAGRSPIMVGVKVIGSTMVAVVTAGSTRRVETQTIAVADKVTASSRTTARVAIVKTVDIAAGTGTTTGTTTSRIHPDSSLLLAVMLVRRTTFLVGPLLISRLLASRSKSLRGLGLSRRRLDNRLLPPLKQSPPHRLLGLLYLGPSL